MKPRVRASLFLVLLACALARAPGATPCTNGFAGPYPCHLVDLLGHLSSTALGGGNGNDIWGWTDPLTGKEYALVGRTIGTAFVDVSDPFNPVHLGLLPTHTSASIWRDIKVYADHAYIVADNAGLHGLQVFDLTQLRTVTNPPVAFAATAHYPLFGSAHNLAINEETGYAYIVGISSGSNRCSGGLHFVNIQNPTNPVFAGCFSADGYTHDTQVVIYRGPDTNYFGREIAFCSNEDTVTIVDVTDKGAPVMLARLGYTNAAYTHQGWLTEDHRYFLVDDELDEINFGFNTRTRLFDVSSLTGPRYMGHYSGATPAIDHNLYIRSNFVYAANYRAGLRILDAAGVAATNLQEVAYFDIYPADDNPAFNGAWSVYPYFASGVVVVSGIEQGLFVLQPNLDDLPLADLAVAKTASPNPLTQTNRLTWTVTVSNRGPDTASGVVLTDTLPPGVMLTLIDQMDDDDSTTGFGGGAHSGTEWTGHRVELTAGGRAAGTGEFVSRVIDAKTAVNWSQLAWLPQHPYGKELPADGLADVGYPPDDDPHEEGFAAFAGVAAAGAFHPEGPSAPRFFADNRFLLRLNESPAVHGTVLNDASGLANHATLFTGDGTADKSTAGRFFGAIELDGTDDHIGFNQPVLSTNDAAHAYSFAAWIRTSSDGVILSQHAVGDPARFALGIVGGQLTYTKGGSNVAAAPVHVTNGLWRHVAFTRDTNGTVTVFVDGEESAPGADAAAFADGITELGRVSDGTGHFAGALDEVALFDRALSHHEVHDLHLRGVLRLKFQVRAGNNPAFAGQPFIGPDGTAATFYSELLNDSPQPPSLPLGGAFAGRYAQYRAVFATDDPNHSPALLSVWIGPDHYDPDIGMVTASQGTCGGTDPVVCHLGSLVSGATATVTIEVTVMTNTTGAITNLASVGTLALDPGALNNAAAAVVLVPDADGDGLPDFVDPDDDNDGLPDEWELLFGLDPLNPADAELDLDGDGFSNRQEHLAGTDPTDPQSSLRILSIEVLGADVLIGFATAPGREYRVEHLHGPLPGGWSNVPGSSLTGAGGPTQTIVAGDATNTNVFYRIRLLAP